MVSSFCCLASAVDLVRDPSVLVIYGPDALSKRKWLNGREFLFDGAYWERTINE